MRTLISAPRQRPGRCVTVHTQPQTMGAAACGMLSQGRKPKGVRTGVRDARQRHALISRHQVVQPAIHRLPVRCLTHARWH